MLGTRLRPVFCSDLAHMDVTDMTEVLEEAYELLEHHLVDERAFREFTFTNVVLAHATSNPGFFRGTVVEDTAAGELGRTTTLR
jgi:hypothetical protein